MKDAIPVWSEGVPDALCTSSNDIPTLTPYLPDATNATGAADGDLSRRLCRALAAWEE